MHALTLGEKMAHRRHRNRDSFNPRKQIETLPENRDMRLSLDSAFRNMPNRGFRLNSFDNRTVDILDNSRKETVRNVGSRNYRSPSQLERSLRREPEKLNTLEKLKYFNARDLSYDLPNKHPICQRRQERREIMFATGKAGKGGQKPLKLPRINIRCK